MKALLCASLVSVIEANPDTVSDAQLTQQFEFERWPNQPYTEATALNGLCAGSDDNKYTVIETKAECEAIAVRKYTETNVGNVVVWPVHSAAYPGGCFVDEELATDLKLVSGTLFFNSNNNSTTIGEGQDGSSMRGARQLCRLVSPEEMFFVSNEERGVCKEGFEGILDYEYCFLALSLQFPDFNYDVKNYWGEDGSSDWPAGCFWLNGFAYFNNLTNPEKRLLKLGMSVGVGDAESRLAALGADAWVMPTAQRVCRKKLSAGLSNEEVVARTHARANSASPPVDESSPCSPFTCSDWSCAHFCGCFAEVPEMETYFDENPLVQALCPEEGENNCDCFERAQDWKEKTAGLLDAFVKSEFDPSKYMELKVQLEAIEEYEPLLADIISSDAQREVDRYESEERKNQENSGTLNSVLVPPDSHYMYVSEPHDT